MRRFVEMPLLVVPIIGLVAGLVLVLLAVTGGRFRLAVVGVLEKIGLHLDVPDHIGTAGRVVAGVVGLLLTVGSSAAMFAGVLDRDGDDNRPEVLAADASCASADAEFGRQMRTKLDETTPCVDVRYAASKAGVGSLSVTATGAAGVAFEVFGPNGRSLGYDAVPAEQPTTMSVHGIPRPGDYEITVRRSGDGMTDLRMTLNLKAAQPVALGSTYSATLTERDADSYLLDSVDAADLIVVTMPDEVVVDVAVTEPDGHLANAGSPPLPFAATAAGPYFLLVEPTDGWHGFYEFSVDTRAALTPPTSTTTTVTTTTVPPTGSTVTQPTSTTTSTTRPATSTTTIALPATTIPPTTLGLPRSFYRDMEVVARDALLEAGFRPRLIPVCSGSVESGLVREIVEEEVDDAGQITEIELDAENGLTDEGRQLPPGSAVVVKISTGNACNS